MPTLPLGLALVTADVRLPITERTRLGTTLEERGAHRLKSVALRMKKTLL